ncbi:MAG: AMP-binding protein [Syntrophales bacterium]|jgi:phenylacetate-CoA ligase
MKKWFDELESRSQKDRETDNWRRLSLMIHLAYNSSDRIRRIFDDFSINPSTEMSKDIWEKIPIITREKLIEMESASPPFGGLQNPDAQIDRIFISPGPVYEPHLSEVDPLWARAYFAAGIGDRDIVLNAFSYHMVAAGLTFHGGLRRVGAAVVPSGTSSSEMQVQLIRDLNITAFTGTPSFLMAIIEKSRELGYEFSRDFRVRKACFAAEPLTPSLRERFEKTYAMDTYQMYGATEVGDIAYECSEKHGWHICEEVMVEIVDPQTGKALPPGQFGEVVVTRFNDVFFLFRFGTGDLSRIVDTPCKCGRTSARLEGIAGRVGEAVKVRGLFLAPSQLRKVSERLNSLPMQVVIQRTGHEDILVIRLERRANANTTGTWDEMFRKVFREICNLRIDHIEWLDPGMIKSEDKLILDERSWK